MPPLFVNASSLPFATHITPLLYAALRRRQYYAGDKERIVCYITLLDGGGIQDVWRREERWAR